jgi:hypothetical protein
MSIVAAITTAHHGTHTAHSHPDGGLDITITLPTAPPTARQTTTDHRTNVTAHDH